MLELNNIFDSAILNNANNLRNALAYLKASKDDSYYLELDSLYNTYISVNIFKDLDNKDDIYCNISLRVALNKDYELVINTTCLVKLDIVIDLLTCIKSNDFASHVNEL